MAEGSAVARAMRTVAAMMSNTVAIAGGLPLNEMHLLSHFFLPRCLAAAFMALVAQASLGAAANTRVDRVFAAWDRPDSPGCAVAVIRAGAVAYARGYGSANLEVGIPNGPGHRV